MLKKGYIQVYFPWCLDDKEDDDDGVEVDEGIDGENGDGGQVWKLTQFFFCFLFVKNH